MAEIYLAQVTGIGGFVKYVVVKRLLPQLAADPAVQRSFLDEARLTARLQHQHIAQIYDIGHAQGEYFFSMEFLHGENLDALLTAVAREGGRIPLEHVLTIVVATASGLHYAHERVSIDGEPLHIVHRDVSPANVVVTFQGGVKLVDFGIAKARVSTEQTRIGVVKGKAPYLSPEQCTQSHVDRRSDIFSLGIVLYELSTMNHLFGPMEDADHTIMERIVNGRIDPPSMLVADYPPGLEAIVMRALETARERRYASAADFQAALEDFARDRGLVLSTTALSRYMKQVFGDRPEPWLTVRPAPKSPADETTVLAEAPAFFDDVTEIETPDEVATRLSLALSTVVDEPEARTDPYGRSDETSDRTEISDAPLFDISPDEERTKLERPHIAEIPTQIMSHPAPVNPFSEATTSPGRLGRRQRYERDGFDGEGTTNDRSIDRATTQRSHDGAEPISENRPVDATLPVGGVTADAEPDNRRWIGIAVILLVAAGCMLWGYLAFG